MYIYTQLGLDTGISIQTLSTLEVFVEVVTSQLAPVSDTIHLNSTPLRDLIQHFSKKLLIFGNFQKVHVICPQLFMAGK